MAKIKNKNLKLRTRRFFVYFSVIKSAINFLVGKWNNCQIKNIISDQNSMSLSFNYISLKCEHKNSHVSLKLLLIQLR